ncbi:YutD family protein [Paenibacillus sp. Leaf72]|uniref:YutD family protein n=1 Tax=Paenibacillus sp. Leaf72 TaxID=1736234 RepID=UPI0009D718D5|nr:YutD family protein [Paenibacillus sp. Leaf72]
MIQIGGKIYELVHENRNGWNQEAFRARYSEVLERYDYIVGDWGYSQLRLKGFFKDNHMKSTRDTMFSYASDYINEYCNFGCPYFVLEKTGSVKQSPELEEVDEEDALTADLNDKLFTALEEAFQSVGQEEDGQVVQAAAPAAKSPGEARALNQSQKPTQQGHSHHSRGSSANRSEDSSQRSGSKQRERRSYRPNGGNGGGGERADRSGGKKPPRGLAASKEIAASAESNEGSPAQPQRQKSPYRGKNRPPKTNHSEPTAE